MGIMKEMARMLSTVSFDFSNLVAVQGQALLPNGRLISRLQI